MEFSCLLMLKHKKYTFKSIKSDHLQGLEVTVLELVYNLWLQLSESPALLHLFSFTEPQQLHSSSSSNNNFVAFTLLTQFLHKSGK